MQAAVAAEETQGSQSRTFERFSGAVVLYPGTKAPEKWGVLKEFFFSLLKEIYQERKKFHTVTLPYCF